MYFQWLEGLHISWYKTMPPWWHSHNWPETGAVGREVSHQTLDGQRFSEHLKHVITSKNAMCSELHISDVNVWPGCCITMYVAKKQWAMWVVSTDSSATLMASDAIIHTYDSKYHWECKYLILYIWVSLCLKQQSYNILMSLLCCNIECGSPILHEVICVLSIHYNGNNTNTSIHASVHNFTQKVKWL